MLRLLGETWIVGLDGCHGLGSAMASRPHDGKPEGLRESLCRRSRSENVQRTFALNHAAAFLQTVAFTSSSRPEDYSYASAFMDPSARLYTRDKSRRGYADDAGDKSCPQHPHTALINVHQRPAVLNSQPRGHA